MAKRIALLIAVFSLAATSMALASGGARDYGWQLTPTGSTARLRGFSAVSERVAWASGYTGTEGTVLRTLNKGASWQSIAPPGTETLQFRDIEAFDRSNAVIMSAGVGTDSRIYATSNGGRSWQLAFQNEEPQAFYDCMTFFDRKHGLALSDPVNGKFRILGTRDGGRSWHVVDADMPPALPDEFAFAASGQCIVSSGDFLDERGHDDDDDDDRGRGEGRGRLAWFATGGGAQARVFRTRDGGRTWRVSATPVRTGPSAGIFALAFRDPGHGIAAGGDFFLETASPDALALSDDGGRNWRLVDPAPNHYRSGAHWVNDRAAIIVGPSGSDVSFDRGRSWQRFDDGSFDTVDCAEEGVCWASGAQGRVAYLIRKH